MYRYVYICIYCIYVMYIYVYIFYIYQCKMDYDKRLKNAMP